MDDGGGVPDCPDRVVAATFTLRLELLEIPPTGLKSPYDSKLHSSPCGEERYATCSLRRCPLHSCHITTDDKYCTYTPDGCLNYMSSRRRWFFLTDPTQHGADQIRWKTAVLSD
ncbi:hypothetical protein M404DRAFT_999698 [Pisolithus tinctorius Marx 270]|uniref:Uncharacterized protein n=1 Tax=Pisolithus tinctorius Marx 270 TaxID=870435 RepID=A0A0C3K7D5_PISTI|nr:hypothetical protein M404DRAFT_999698 [Pisolithus tinctorius Marx 270]